MEAMRTVTLGTGIFTVQVKMFKADASNGLSGSTFCSCGPEGSQLSKKVAFETKLTSIYRCPACHAEYGHWSKAPRRGVVVGEQVYFFTKEELDAVELPVYDHMEIQKVVPVGRVAIPHSFLGSYYLLPDLEAPEPLLRTYCLLVEALSRRGWAVLTKLTLTTKVHRYAIIPDRKTNILMALEIGDRRTLPYEVRKAPVVDSQVTQLEAILQPFYDDEGRLEADLDALSMMIQGRLDANFKAI